MRFHADLHVHSKHSRATSRDLDLEHLAAWACRKGIGVVATGDFTHPVWCAELKDKLVAAEPGLFRLRDEVENAVLRTLPAPCRAPVRFMLEVEISTIYKKADRTRKIHHLIYAPDFDTVDRLSARLARIGNIASDGRPILGLDSRDLLEITLESGPQAYLVPAHVWTPWFAALGSQSGFNSIADCYGDLTDRIFAVETGLSSDPPMNWRVSFLDRYRLTSNSDAHSPGKLGREATAFDCEIDYFAIKRALETGSGYLGTVEFFPDEGKYHLDGHRKCEMRLTPKETLAHNGRCPACGESVTIGVEHRVEMLADRPEQNLSPPSTAGTVTNLVPLPEILSELTGTGPQSRSVERNYNVATAKLGAELDILQSVPIEDIAHAGSPLLAEAITRLRAGRVIRQPGYDGEYGVIRLFEDGELRHLTSGGQLFDAPVATAKRKAAIIPAGKDDVAEPARSQARLVRAGLATGRGILAELDDAQRAAAETITGPLMIVAGPGSGKTRTLTYRIAHLIADHGIAPEHCLAITFTRRAAAEMRERLARLLPERAGAVPIHTFHSLGLALLREHTSAAGLPARLPCRRRGRAPGAADRYARRHAAPCGAHAARHLHGETDPPLGGRRGRGSDDPVPARARAAQLDRLRRSRSTVGPCTGGQPRRHSRLPRPLPLDLGRRVPGRRRAAISSAHAAYSTGRQFLRHRRPQSGDLRIPRRRRVLLRPLPAGLSCEQGGQARAQLSFDRDDRHRLGSTDDASGRRLRRGRARDA